MRYETARQILAEAIYKSSDKRVKIKQSGHDAHIQQVDDNKWVFTHRGIVGYVHKARNRMDGSRYHASHIQVLGKDVGIPVIPGIHKTMNDAIHNAHEHTRSHMSKV